MMVQELKETDLLRIEFSKMQIPVVPRESGIYVLANYSGFILYIGVSKNLQRRMLEHLNAETKSQLTPVGKAYWFFYKTCPETDFRPGERGWLHQFQLHEGNLPYFNKIEAPS